ncbi:MAG: methyltransferase domain-containing protein [Alkalispirochaeta sp.]
MDMSDDSPTQDYYRTRAAELAEIYDSVNLTHLHHLSTLLRPKDRVLDVGCGTGRDLAWLRDRGYTAEGVDGSAEMLAEAQQRYAIPAETLHRDVLPALDTVQRTFHAITCIHVLHHLDDRTLLDALYRLRALLVPGGFLVIKVPSAHPEVAENRHVDGRRYVLRNPGQYRFFLERLGLRQTAAIDEHHEETGADWHIQVYVAPLEAGLNSMETVESILWDDRKVNTYKFALIRAVADLATHRTQVGTWLPDGRVAIPIDQIAERWIEYYWPLVTPRSSHRGDGVLLGQQISGKQDMTFRRSLTELAEMWRDAGGYPAFRAAADRNVLSAGQHQMLQRVYRDIRRAIGQPVKYAGNARTGKQLFEMYGSAVITRGSLWTELALMGRWIEDSVLLRWADFVAGIKNQNAAVSSEEILGLLLAPRRIDHDTSIARGVYGSFLDTPGGLECVWSGVTIAGTGHMEVDHAIPWAMWFSNDLWNLLPAESAVNNKKRDKLPSRPLIDSSRTRILRSWEMLWEAEPAMFGLHAARLVGEPLHTFGRRQRDELFDMFKNSIEFTAANRAAERWAP